MSIEVVAKKEQGEKYKAVIYATEVVEGDYGPQVLVKLVEPNGNIERRYLPIPMTEKNRTGRWFTALLGGYPEGTVDETTIEGMPVYMIYGPKFKAPDETVLDMVKVRKADKDEDPAGIANDQKARDDAEAPF